MEAVSEAQERGVVERLRGWLRGEVIGPGDVAYDAARSVYLTGFDRRPAAVARPLDAAEVARVVEVAREAGLPLAVRSGGHGIAGHGTTDGGIVLDLSALKGLEVDAADRSAWAGTGLTAGEYTRAVGEHGLATGFGDSATVGIGGITLNGGIGFLHRRHGLTIDNVLAAEVVAADGRVLHTDAGTHPDLFWAIRGGGGNFGVVTRLRYRLVEVNTVVGGMLILPATPAVLAAAIAEAESAPETVSGMFNVTMAPPMPFLPAEVHGKPIIMAVLVCDDEPDAGARAFAPFRALAKPLADMVSPIAYPRMFDGPSPPHPSSMLLRTFFMDTFAQADAEQVLDALHRSTAPMKVAQFRVMGGAVSRVPADATAFAHRDRRIMATMAVAAFEGDAAEHGPWLDALMGALRNGEAGAYVGFLGDEGEARAREAYPGGAWDRLREIKATYDPQNLFRLNQNIPPAA